ncbi:MAG TPA: TIGR02147 family protein [Chitinispirillaceae bacterium]|nr:TIGR02147 family protein [Chitinispirillaceae bacterium]
MISIYDYLNYREYLEDFYQDKKSGNSHFSFQVFATQAGFQSKSFIKLVIDGKKNLTDESINQINRALKLTDKALTYFKYLVAFNQAKSITIQNMYFEKLQLCNSHTKARLLLQQQYDYFSQWYHSTIRELICTTDFKEDYEKLGKMLKPAISARKARDSVMLLLKLGLIKKNGDLYEQTDSSVTTGDEVRSLAVQNFHLQNLMITRESISTCKSSGRDISTLIVSMSDEDFLKVKAEIQQFRKKLLDMIKPDKKARRTYHVNFQLFPTSENIYE